jgi:hypothetical protein
VEKVEKGEGDSRKVREEERESGGLRNHKKSPHP